MRQPAEAIMIISEFTQEGHYFLSMTHSTGCSNDTPGLILKRFRREESPADYEKVLQLRIEVFIEEQNVPVEEELDGQDDDAVHCLVTDAETGDAIATGRYLSYQEACQTRPVAKIGRIAVKKANRGQKLGLLVMRELLQAVREEGFEQAILDSQSHARVFYEKLGFIAEGEEFQEAGIMHYRMRLVLNP